MKKLKNLTKKILKFIGINIPPIYRKSALADYYLKGKRGIEIGGAYYCHFGLNTLNVNYTDEETIFSKEERNINNKCIKVDIIAEGDNLPFKDNIWDFVINSHVLEHFYDPIKAIEEWIRVIKPGGYLFMIIPHKERTFDKGKDRTTLNELIQRHNRNEKEPRLYDYHYSIWITEDLLELCKYMNLNVIDYKYQDDMRKDGFIIVVQK